MKIAITGGAGWLARSLTTRLAEAGHQLVLVDRVEPDEATVFDPDSPGGRRREPLSPDWPYHKISIDDRAAVDAALEGCDVVVHLAAKPTGDWDGAEDTMQTNVMGTHTVLRSAVAQGVRRVVNASSINAFGTFYWRITDDAITWSHLPLTEAERPIPQDPYSLSKLITEEMTAAFTRAHGLETVNLRFAGVWPEARYERILVDGLTPTTAWSDDLFQWAHVGDIAAGIALAATVPGVDPAPIVLSAADTRVPEATMDILQRFRPDLLPLLTGPLPGRDPLLSIGRARSVLGYEPQYSLAAAVRSDA